MPVRNAGPGLALTMVSIAESEFLSRSASHWTRPGGKSTMMVEPL